MATALCPKCSQVMVSLGGDRKGNWWFKCQQNGHGHFSVAQRTVVRQQLTLNRAIKRYAQRR